MKQRMRLMVLLALLGASLFLLAQRRLSPLPEDDLAVVNAQAREIFGITDALAVGPGKSVVGIYNRRGRVCNGIVVGGERVIAKWSDLIRQGDLVVSSDGKEALELEPLGYYADEDLVLLKVPGLEAPPITWGKGSELEAGTMLVSVNANGQSTALGVVSVERRSLRDEEEGFLGIRMDFTWKGKGVRVEEVTPGGAAEEAGLQVGDVVTHVGGDEVAGMVEMQTRIRRYGAGDQVELRLLRADQEISLKPTLKGYQERVRESPRIRQMDRMSGRVSRVRDRFPSVIQSDLELEPEDSGSPVLDLEGNVVGMVIARAGRVSTLILPAEDIEKALRTEPQKAAREEVAEQRVVPDENGEPAERDETLDLMRREMETMRRMLEEMRREEE